MYNIKTLSGVTIMNSPYEKELRRLYIEENKTDQEIGEIYGVIGGTVCGWRRKYGIKGINARHRKFFDNPQTPISKKQMSIILGTLLGDGCLKSQSTSAYLSISHSEKQKDYLYWMYDQLKSICPTAPKSYISKGKYTTFYFASESRNDLLELRNRIYIPKKTVSKLWCDNIDEIALSIWFMDDGNLAYVNKSRSEFSFATNSFSEAENYLLSSTLKDKFDINSSVKPISKPSGIQYNLVVDDDSFDLFAGIIKPYVIDSMSYKLPCGGDVDMLKRNIKTNIDRESLYKMYHFDKMTYDQIAARLCIHKSTVRKYMNIFSIEPRNNSSAQLHGKNNQNQRGMDGKFLPLNFEDDVTAKKLFEEIRLVGFPYIEVKDDEHYIGVIDKTCGSAINKQNEDGSFAYSRMGIELCSAFCPQIFSMASDKSKTPLEIFNDDIMLMDCIRRTIKYAKRKTVASVRQGLKTYKKNRCVTIFPPLWAKTALNEVFGQEGRRDLSVFDFSCGFAGRLIGSYSSGIVSKYMGVDPLASNIKSHNRIDRLIQRHATLKGRNFKTKFVMDTAENVLSSLHGEIDVVITSPPYFIKERYSSDESQCYVSHNGYSEWLEGWLRPILEKSYDLICKNGAIIIFASDIKSYPVGQDTCSILEAISKSKPQVLEFVQPSVEYLRKKGNRKVDTAWVVRK
jgi:transposase